MLGQRFVGAVNYDIWFHAVVTQNQNSEWFNPMNTLDVNNGARLDLRLAIEDEFNVLWINVHARRSNDDVFLAAFKIKIALLVQFADVAGVKPAIVRSS